MLRYAVGVVVIGVVAAHFLSDLQRLSTGQENTANGDKVALANLAEEQQETRPSRNTDYSGRTARIKMDNRGHFYTTARMNGARVEVLVDTGATSVAINQSTARKLGINLRKEDFKHSVSTANGKTKAAAAIIDRIEIGRVEVRNVQAAVLSDNALGGTLLGMSFLGQLKGFEVKNRELLLTQ